MSRSFDDCWPPSQAMASVSRKPSRQYRVAQATRRSRLILSFKKRMYSFTFTVVLFGYLAEGSNLRPTGIREHNIELALLSLDLREEVIKIAKVGGIPLYGGHILSDFLDRCRQLRLTAPRYEDVGAFAGPRSDGACSDRAEPGGVARCLGGSCSSRIPVLDVPPRRR
jgi:hypothetical protein